MREWARAGPGGVVGRLVVAVALVVLASPAAAEAPETAGLGLLVMGLADGRSLRGLVGAIAVGAVVVGAIAWVASGLVNVPLATGLATGLGIAVGGGLGSVVWLLAVGEEETDDTEEMTVDMAEDDDAVPGPEPADLFDANPDPILYVDATDAAPVVLGANPAFAETFDGDVAEGTPLAEALAVLEGGEDVLEAANAGEPYAETHACETGAGTERRHVRVIPIDVGQRRSAYVVLGPPVAAG